MKRLFGAAIAAAVLAALTLPSAPASAQTYEGNGAVKSAICSQVVAGYPTACAPTIGDTPFETAVTTTLTQFIAAPASGSIRFTFVSYAAAESATGGALEIESGTGTNCATSTKLVAPVAWVPVGTVNGSLGWGEGAVFILPAKSAACAVVSAGTVTFAAIGGTYAVF